jgi:hypothetical protein
MLSLLLMKVYRPANRGSTRKEKIMDTAVRFMIDADASPGVLPRLLEPFAKRDLTPDRMWSDRSAVAGVLHVEIALNAMPEREVHLVEGNLRSVVGVRSLSLLRKIQDQHRTLSSRLIALSNSASTVSCLSQAASLNWETATQASE